MPNLSGPVGSQALASAKTSSVSIGSGCPFTSVDSAPARPKAPSIAIPQELLNVELTSEQKELIKASVPALAAHGLDITKLFYSNMLRHHPELKAIFNNKNQEHFEQPRALANAVMAYAINIDDLTPLLPAVELISNKHASLYVQPEHYKIVGKYLIEAIAEVLGAAVTPELGEAWTLAYWRLAEVLMKREHQLYTASKNWTDWEKFRIARKEKESDEITSFYLEPVDASFKPLPSFRPGQYISIQLDVPQLGHKQARQYSLSDCPNPDYYRVSIKREDGQNPGLISVFMHQKLTVGDVISVAHPMGDFFLGAEIPKDTPLVFVSGGVGLTPLTSMLLSRLAIYPEQQISWIHGARSASVRAFNKSMQDAQRTNKNLQIKWFNSSPQPSERKDHDYNFAGPVDLSKLDPKKTLFLGDDLAQYYVCGPAGFMKSIQKALEERGVSSSRIHMELFGTGGIATV